MKFRKERDEFGELSERLSSERPTPSDSFERELLSRVPSSRRSTARPLLAAVVTLTVAAGIAASGGVSYAVDSAANALSSMSHDNNGNGNGNGNGGSADGQYGAGSCVGNVNPSGNHIPNAGTGTGHSGQNPDGFYLISSSNSVDVEVVDLSNNVVIGTFPSGSVIKVTQKSAKNPDDSYIKIGGNGANAVIAHVFSGGDVAIIPVDGGTPTICLVPKPPK